jgi:hypothetical protein
LSPNAPDRQATDAHQRPRHDQVHADIIAFNQTNADKALRDERAGLEQGHRPGEPPGRATILPAEKRLP